MIVAPINVNLSGRSPKTIIANKIAKISLEYLKGDITDISPFRVASTNIKYEKQPNMVIIITTSHWMFDRVMKSPKKGKEKIPPIVVNINAYNETVIEWTSLLMFLVTKSLSAKHATPNKTIKEEVWKLSRPGFNINITPKKPKKTALHLRQPTISLKIKTAPKVMKSGSACKIDDTVDKGNNEIDVTINTAPIISAIQRIMKNLLFIILFPKIGMPLIIDIEPSKNVAQRPT